MTRAPLTTATFDDFLATLARIRDDYVNSAERDHDELETVEGFGYVLQMVGHVSEFLIESDRERPRFSLIVSRPARSWVTTPTRSTTRPRSAATGPTGSRAGAPGRTTSRTPCTALIRPVVSAARCSPTSTTTT